MGAQSPRSSVRASPSRSVQPATCRATYPSPLPRPPRPAAVEVDGVKLRPGCPRRRRRARGLLLVDGRARAGRDAGSRPRPGPSRRTAARAPTRPRSSATISGTSAKTGASACWIRYSRPMSCAPAALSPLGGRRRIRSTSGPGQQVGQVGRPAGELADLGRAGEPVAPARPVRRSQSATAVDVEGVLLADRPAAGSSGSPRRSQVVPSRPAWPPGAASGRRRPPGRCSLRS